MLHLFHPAVVHFPIVFLAAGGLMETAGILGRRPGWERAGARLVLAGTACLVVTVAAGYLAANSVTLPDGAQGALDAHERAALILLAVFLVLVLWKAWGGGAVADAARLPYALALLAGVGVLVWAALLGGRLVYAWGVGVAGR
jgi:uncharacterized membrane protein